MTKKKVPTTTLTYAEAIARFPGIAAGEALRQEECPDAEVFATRISVGEGVWGLLLMLPDRFAPYLLALARETPKFFVRATADLMSCEPVLCWKLPAATPPLTIDASSYLLPNRWCDAERVPVIWIAGDSVVAGSFQVKRGMADQDHINSFTAINYRPHCVHSDEALAAVRDLAEPDPDPWCVNAYGALPPEPPFVPLASVIRS